MVDRDDIGYPISVNVKGGFYEHSKSYTFSQKWEVATTYLKLGEDNFPMKPSMSSLARHAIVIWLGKWLS
jgi:hypothetical protein